MTKDGFNDASKGFHDKVYLSTPDIELGARALCKAMARLDGENMGETITKLVCDKALQRFHPATIRDILECENIKSEEIDQYLGMVIK